MAASLLPKKACAAAALGLIALVVSIVVPYASQVVLRSQVSKILPLQNGSDIYNSWVDPHNDASENLQFWIFDVLNAEEVITSGSIPMLMERGPFTYTQISLKTNISFDSDADDTVEYQQLGTYYFNPSLSAHGEDLVVTTLNFPVYVVEYSFRNQRTPEELLDIIVRMIENEHLFITISVKELLWGYADKFLTDLQQILQNPRVAKLIQDFNITVPQFDANFGYYYNRNGSSRGVFQVFRGHEDISKFLTVASWEGMRHLNYWRNDRCNMINGTDGSEFPPFLEKSSVRYLFSTDLCRSVPLVYYNDVSVQGISTYEIRMPSTVFSYGSSEADNLCYCSENGACPLDGVLDLGPCYDGAPVFISQPHFLNGDESYARGVTGLEPSRDEHALYLQVEPNTGVVLDCAIRLQLNMKLTNISALKEARNLPELLMLPLIWFNSTAVVTQTRLDEFKSQFVIFLQVCAILPYVFIGVGAALLLLSIIYVGHARCRRTKSRKHVAYAETPDEKSPLMRTRNGNGLPIN